MNRETYNFLEYLAEKLGCPCTVQTLDDEDELINPLETDMLEYCDGKCPSLNNFECWKRVYEMTVDFMEEPKTFHDPVREEDIEL